MKRILILFIVLLLVLPLFAFPVSAENEYTSMTIFWQDKYCVEILGDDAFRTELINAIVEHTEVPYSYSEENDFGTINFFSDPGIEDGIYYVESKRLWITDCSIVFVCNEKPIKELIEEFSKQIKIQTDYDGSSAWVVDVTSFKTYEEDKEEEKDKNEEGFFETFSKIGKGFLNFFNIFKDIDIGDTRTTLDNGGFNFIDENSRLNSLISAIYKVLYPIGFAVMLLCWSFGIAKSTISSSLDIRDRNSIIHGVLSLIIGLAAMSLAPQILTVLTGVSQWLCSLVGSAEWLTWDNWETVTDISINEIISGAFNNLTASLLVLVFIEYVFMINILWIALLQCLSPIFIGLMANQSTRKISFNFIKEYFKALLVPVVTLIYYRLTSTLLWDLDQSQQGVAVGLIGSIVLGIATVSVAGKKLDKLIN